MLKDTNSLDVAHMVYFFNWVTWVCVWSILLIRKTLNEKVQGVLQLQFAADPRRQEEEETTKQ